METPPAITNIVPLCSVVAYKKLGCYWARRIFLTPALNTSNPGCRLTEHIPVKGKRQSPAMLFPMRETRHSTTDQVASNALLLNCAQVTQLLYRCSMMLHLVFLYFISCIAVINIFFGISHLKRAVLILWHSPCLAQGAANRPKQFHILLNTNWKKVASLFRGFLGSWSDLERFLLTPSHSLHGNTFHVSKRPPWSYLAHLRA